MKSQKITLSAGKKERQKISVSAKSISAKASFVRPTKIKFIGKE